MTVDEMNDEFEILYDAAGEETPDLDIYEKSLFLTNAMYEIITNLYDKYVSLGSKGDTDEAIKHSAIDGLLNVFSSVIAVNRVNSSIKFNDQKLVVTSVAQPLDSMGVVYEEVEFKDSTAATLVTRPIPVKHSFISRLSKSPFHTPDPDTIYSIASGDARGGKLVDFIHNNTFIFSEYRGTYVKRPYPIILKDLTTAYPNETLTIEGKTSPHVGYASDVDVNLHKKIVQRAVELAILHYRDNTLSNNMQAKLK